LQHPTQTTSLGTDEVNQLAAHLDRYAAFIKEYAPSTATLTQPINHLGKADNFNAFYFKKAPLGGILATFTQLEAQVRRSEIEALMVQSQKFGSGCCFCFDRIGILAVAESNTVAPGALYRAQLLLSQSISDVEFSTVSVNGRALLKDANRQNTVKFRIPLAHPGQPDTVQAQWHGTIRAIAFPGDTTWQLDVPYFIVKQPKP
jgi:hypothetical protein